MPVKSKYIAIVDYKLGNVFSIQNACRRVGIEAIVTSNSDKILYASGVILPGVGAFGEAMARVKTLNLDSVLQEYVALGKPLIGICLGMQLLMTSSAEFSEHEGLGFINGRVEHLEKLGLFKGDFKVPHIGWNVLLNPTLENERVKWSNTPLELVEEGMSAYFVHSLHVLLDDPTNCLSLSPYGNTHICSSVVSENVYGFQFHPENSGEQGLKIYEAIGRMIN